MEQSKTLRSAGVTCRLQAWPHQPATRIPCDRPPSSSLVKRPILESASSSLPSSLSLGDPKGLEIMAQWAEGTPGPQVPSWAEGGSSGETEEPHLEATCEPPNSAAHWCKCWLLVVVGSWPAEAFAQMLNVSSEAQSELVSPWAPHVNAGSQGCSCPEEPHPSLLVAPPSPPPTIGFSSSKRAFFFTTLRVKKRALKPINTSIYILR